MSLDINTEKGQETVRQEEILIKRIEEYWNVKIISTKKKDENASAACDGFITRNNIVGAVIEDKCRDLSYEKLCYFGSWLVTYNKIQKCQILSAYLKVPFVGFLYLLPDDIIMYWNITDEKGKYLFDIPHEKTETQKTVNGGKIIRDNAYLPIEFGKILENLNNKK